MLWLTPKGVPVDFPSKAVALCHPTIVMVPYGEVVMNVTHRALSLCLFFSLSFFTLVSDDYLAFKSLQREINWNDTLSFPINSCLESSKPTSQGILALHSLAFHKTTFVAQLGAATCPPCPFSCSLRLTSLYFNYYNCT